MQNEKNPLRLVEYIIAGFVVILIGALVGWYFFLQSQKKQIAVVDSGRGLNTSVPAFYNNNGSTVQNIANSVGSNTMGGSSTAPGIPTADTTGGGKKITRLWEVDNVPVAGMGFVQASTTRSLYFSERASGYILSANQFSQTITRISGTLRPKVYNALFATDGSVIQQTLDASSSVQTFAGSIVQSTSTDDTSPKVSLVGQMLVPNIRAITMNPTTKDILYLTEATSGGITVSTTTFANAKQTSIFSSPIASWIPQWLPDGLITLTLSPSDGVPGYAYQLMTKDNSLVPLVRYVNGLMINLHPAASALFYSGSTGSDVSLFLRSDSGTTTIKVPLATVASKCVWGPDVISVSTSSVATSTVATSTKATKVRNTGPIITVRHTHTAYCAAPAKKTDSNFLTSWFRGETHTSDEWWKVDTNTGSTTLIYSPYKEDSLDLDVIKPTIDPDGNYIAFINARDQSLWMLRINP